VSSPQRSVGVSVCRDGPYFVYRFYRAAYATRIGAAAAYAVVLGVSMSVTFVYCVETAEVTAKVAMDCEQETELRLHATAELLVCSTIM